jgi:hypothetical protein
MNVEYLKVAMEKEMFDAGPAEERDTCGTVDTRSVAVQYVVRQYCCILGSFCGRTQVYQVSE